jgi:exopolysaccharide production protein ExoQ
VNKSAEPTRVRPTIRVSSLHRLLYPSSVYFLLLSMGAFYIVDLLIYGEGWYGKTGDKVTQSVNLLGIGISLFLFWLSRQQPTRVGRALPFAIAAFLLTSAFWSADPRLAITQGILYFFIVLGFIALVELWDADALICLVAKVIAVCAVLSLISSTHKAYGDFNGIFSQKNVLGQVMAAGVLAALHGWRTRRSPIYLMIVVLCATVAFLSQTTTSLLVIALFVAIDILGRLCLRGGGLRALGVVGAIIAAAVVIFFLLNEAMFLEMLGKDPTLTGRREFWPYVIDYIYQRPLFGWGYLGFWTPANPAATSITETIGREHEVWLTLANAHNTLLEMLLEIGVVGTTFFVALMTRYAIVAMRCLNGPAKQLGLSTLMMMSGLTILCISEVVLLPAQAIFTGLFFMLGMACEKKIWQYRHRRISAKICAVSVGRWPAPPLARSIGSRSIKT